VGGRRREPINGAIKRNLAGKVTGKNGVKGGYCLELERIHKYQNGIQLDQTTYKAIGKGSFKEFEKSDILVGKSEEGKGRGNAAMLPKRITEEAILSGGTSLIRDHKKAREQQG